MARVPLCEVTALRSGLSFTISDGDFVRKGSYWFIFEDTRSVSWSFHIESGNKFLSAADSLKNLFCVAITKRRLDDDDQPSVCTLYVFRDDDIRGLFINGNFSFTGLQFSAEIQKGEKLILPDSI